MEEAAASAGGNGHTNGSWSVSALEVGGSNVAADDGSGRKGKEFASGTLWSGSSIFDSWLIASAAQVQTSQYVLLIKFLVFLISF